MPSFIILLQTFVPIYFLLCVVRKLVFFVVISTSVFDPLLPVARIFLLYVLKLRLFAVSVKPNFVESLPCRVDIVSICLHLPCNRLNLISQIRLNSGSYLMLQILVDILVLYELSYILLIKILLVENLFHC